jgi:hypothetical protein
MACEEAGSQAYEFAKREGQDPGAARRSALAARAPHAMDHKHPGVHFDRMSTAGIEQRMNDDMARRRGALNGT